MSTHSNSLSMSHWPLAVLSHCESLPLILQRTSLKLANESQWESILFLFFSFFFFESKLRSRSFHHHMAYWSQTQQPAGIRSNWSENNVLTFETQQEDGLSFTPECFSGSYASPLAHQERSDSDSPMRIFVLGIYCLSHCFQTILPLNTVVIRGLSLHGSGHLGLYATNNFQ